MTTQDSWQVTNDFVTRDFVTRDFVTRDFVTRDFVTTNVSETAVFHQNNQSGQIALSNDSLW